MAKRKLIKIYKLNEETEKFEYYNTYHTLNINKSSGKEYFNARTEISTSTLNFELRYAESLKDIIYNTQLYQIVYDGIEFNIINADNFKEQNRKITLVGDSRNVK